MAIQQRIVPGAAGLALFIAFGLGVNGEFWTQWWFYVGLGVFVSAVIVEPFYTRPQDAIVNGIGGVAAWASAERAPLESLWFVYLGFCVVVGLAGLIAALADGELSPSSRRAKNLTYQLSRRFGRAVIIGALALILEVIRLGGIDPDAATTLAVGTALLLVGLAPDWHRVLLAIGVAPSQAAEAIAALGPRVLLVRAPGERFETGMAVTVRCDRSELAGWVIAAMPAEDGPRYEIALEADCVAFFSALPAEIGIMPREESALVVGAAGAGSTDLTLSFVPLQPLRVGEAVLLAERDRLVYQVTSLELRRETWLGGAAIVPAATATQIGRPESQYLRSHPVLPDAHCLIERPEVISETVADKHVRIGVVLGTEIEIGINTDESASGHFAVLGMSGMGKTTAAVRICQALSSTNCVVAMDSTGEYRGRLGVAHPHPPQLDENGFWVNEMAGDLPIEAKKFITEVLKLGVDEYEAAGSQRRVVVLEEAHSFIPEWNIATRDQQAAAAFSNRLILQARKFGIRFVIVSQRSAIVAKSALTQCENYIVLRTIDETGLDFLETVVGGVVRRAIPRLRRFEAVCVGPAFNSDSAVVVQLDPASPVAAAS